MIGTLALKGALAPDRHGDTLSLPRFSVYPPTHGAPTKFKGTPHTCRMDSPLNSCCAFHFAGVHGKLAPGARSKPSTQLTLPQTQVATAAPTAQPAPPASELLLPPIVLSPLEQPGMVGSLRQTAQHTQHAQRGCPLSSTQSQPSTPTADCQQPTAARECTSLPLSAEPPLKPAAQSPTTALQTASQPPVLPSHQPPTSLPPSNVMHPLSPQPSLPPPLSNAMYPLATQPSLPLPISNAMPMLQTGSPLPVAASQATIDQQSVNLMGLLDGERSRPVFQYPQFSSPA